MDTNKFERLAANVRDAAAAEKVLAAELVDVQARWRDSNEALNVHNKALDAFLKEAREQAVKPA